MKGPWPTLLLSAVMLPEAVLGADRVEDLYVNRCAAGHGAPGQAAKWRPLIAAVMVPAAVRGARSGAELYTTKCAGCHKLEGQGVPGLSPALANSAFVSGDVEELVRTVLKGRRAMPAFQGELTDEDVAKVLSFLRTSFNKARPISTRMVGRVRKSIGELSPEDPNRRSPARCAENGATVPRGLEEVRVR